MCVKTVGRNSESHYHKLYPQACGREVLFHLALKSTQLFKETKHSSTQEPVLPFLCEIMLDLQKTCKNSMENSPVPCTLWWHIVHKHNSERHRNMNIGRTLRRKCSWRLNPNNFSIGALSNHRLHWRPRHAVSCQIYLVGLLQCEKVSQPFLVFHDQSHSSRRMYSHVLHNHLFPVLKE